LAIEALLHVIKKNKNVKLLIGGRGSQYDILNQQIINLNLQKNVTLLGYINDNEITDIILNADIFMSLDIGDFDISPYSALALKKPIIWTVEMDMDQDLTNSGMISIVEPHYNSVADAIVKNITDKQLNGGIKDFTFLKNYTWENYFGTILDSCNGKN
jgi:glycosyltransferase involved in cell wall biosynthesis